MRFDLLLAQYLQQHKRLNLPGIGTFESDFAGNAGEDGGKQRHSGNGVVFRNVPVSKADDDLISFISEHTGKMKPLAVSDLESYLTLGKQFLYIGKPFYLEGIGTLQFTKSGNFDFTPGEYAAVKIEEPIAERVEERRKPAPEEADEEYHGSRGGGRKVLLWLIVLLCVGLIGWGAYYFYTENARQQVFVPADSTNGNRPDSSALATPQAANGTVTVTDTGAAGPVTPAAPAATAAPAGTFRFVVERTSDKARALKRYRALKSYGSNVQLETTDSTNFKIYYNLPATAADTLRMRDSLNRWYYGNNKLMRVVVEQ